jgi:transposase
LLTLAGWSSGRIGEAFGVREDTVRLWRMRFMQGGVAGLRTHSPPGASPVKAEAALAIAEDVLSVPVANRTNWTLRRLAAQIEQRAGLRISASRLSVVLRKKGISVGAAPGTR